MNKLAAAGVAVAAAVIVAVAVSGISPQEQDMARTYGTVATDTGSPILGDPDAPITLIEFGDYQCHACHRWFHNIKPAIQENYIDTGRANLIFMDMAFLGSDSPKAAQATYCANEQGMYWEYHDHLYESQESRIDNGWAGTDNLKAFASDLGMDTESFNSCLDSGRYSERVQENISEGQRNGVRATPTFIIVLADGDQQVVRGAQPYSVFNQIMS